MIQPLQQQTRNIVVGSIVAVVVLSIFWFLAVPSPVVVNWERLPSWLQFGAIQWRWRC